MAKITYNNKDKNGAAPLNQFRDVDANEIKTSVNAAYDAIDAKVETTDFNMTEIADGTDFRKVRVYTTAPDVATLTTGSLIAIDEPEP